MSVLCLNNKRLWLNQKYNKNPMEFSYTLIYINSI